MWEKKFGEKETEINTNIVIQTDLVQNQSYKLKAQLAKPILSKQDSINFGIV